MECIGDFPIVNKNDPLHKPTIAPQSARELFDNLSKVASGFSADDVATAAANLLVNAIRQNKATRDSASNAFDEIASRAKHVLLEQHYDLMGKRRNVFPFHQTIEVPLIKSKTKIHGM